MSIINDETITIAIDTQGGMCDRIMLGRKGIIANANASIESWKFNAPDDEDIQALEYIVGETDDDIENAKSVLSTDNFLVLFVTKGNAIVTDNLIVGSNIVSYKPNKELTIVDVNTITFDNNNLYKIY